MKDPFFIYADLECLLEKMSIHHNNSKKSATIKNYKHTPSGFSRFTQCSLDATKNKLQSWS